MKKRVKKAKTKKKTTKKKKEKKSLRAKKASALKNLKKKRISSKKKRASVGSKQRQKEQKQEEKKKSRQTKTSWKILRGMRDILPEEWRWWDYFLVQAKQLAQDYGYRHIETPILESISLFERSTGLSSDVVSKQMYSFKDKSGDAVVLRPEITPSIARAYIEKGLFSRPQPVKLFYFGPNFRYERPQAGRYRQFYQFGLEVLGSDLPAIDAEIILISKILFENLGLKVSLQINSLGCSECRKIYRAKLIKFLRSNQHSLCPDCQRRLRENPLRVLDCKNPRCRDILSSAPQIIDNLCDDCHKHFVEVLEYLDAADAAYELNPYLVRGLDYYTRTVFEILPERSHISIERNAEALTPEPLAVRQALGGGGRYDDLIEKFSHRHIPSIGVGFGVDRIVEELKAQNVSLPREKKPDVFLAQIGKRASKQCLPLFEELRANNLRCAMNIAKESLRAQLEQANNMGARFVLILGHQEVQDGTIIIRNMINGIQETIPQNKLVNYLKKILRGSKTIPQK